MKTFIDLSAARIQAWITRVPRLRARRGASSALAEATSNAAIEALVRGDGAAINSAAGDADGKVSLWLPGDGQVVAKSAQELARKVLTHLRGRLPALEFEAAIGAGPDYVTAFASQIQPKHERGEILRDLPSLYEFPLQRLCDLCGVDPARHVLKLGSPQDVDSELLRLCDDCHVRMAAGAVPAKSSEGRLQAALAASGCELDLADDFDALARLGKRKKNHLATVYADGNRMGWFFSQAMRAGVPNKDALSLGLTQVTWAALVAASRTVCHSYDAALPVVPHVIGGDDVLVSLPADRAWPFVRTFLASFDAGMNQLVREYAPPLVSEQPHISAGIVFTHATYPFSRCSDMAAALLSRAKRRGAGRESTVLWADVTQEGESIPEDRIPWTLLEVDGHANALEELVNKMPDSTASTLIHAIGHRDPVIGSARAQVVAYRLDQHALIQPFLTLQDRTSEASALREALSMRRWWS